jgi:hypothetical protein
MTAAASTPATPATRSRTTSILVTGALAGAAAAVATTAVAAIAKGFGVPMEAAPQSAAVAEPLPMVAFSQVTLMSTAIGVVLALALNRWARHPARTFVITTVVLTVLSVAPSVTAGHATLATKAVLVLTHIVAAAIVIPLLAGRLPATGDDD